MPRGYYKKNQNKSKTAAAMINSAPTYEDLGKEMEEALIKRDRNKMTVSELRSLVYTLEERTKLDR